MVNKEKGVDLIPALGWALAIAILLLVESGPWQVTVAILFASSGFHGVASGWVKGKLKFWFRVISSLCFVAGILVAVAGVHLGELRLA